MIKKKWSFFVIVSLSIITVQCGPDDRQKNINKATQEFALTIRTFIGFFEDDLKNCDQFLNIYDELSEEPQTCDNGDDGSFQLTKDSVTCTNGPPINAQANFTLMQDNCRDNGIGVTSTGPMAMVISFSSEGNIGMLVSDGIVVQDMNFVFENFETKVDFASNSLSCSDSDDMTVDGDNCNVTSNCRECKL